MPPRVTVGLPVYEGKRFLAGALDSLLAQDFDDFEVIVSDNGSTDGSADLAADYAARDGRVHVVRGFRNVGAARNFNRVFELGRGELFTWAACDDRHAPTWMARCVEALDADPGAVLAYTRALDVDEAGNVLGPVDFELATDDPDPARRFGEVVLRPHPCFQVFGVIRADVLAMTQLLGPYSGSDRVLLADLALRGRFVEIPERLFLHGEHPDRSVNVHYYEHERYAWFDPRRASLTAFPNWRLLGEYARVVHRAPLSRDDRRRAYARLGPWIGRFGKELARDLARPVRRVLTSP